MSLRIKTIRDLVNAPRYYDLTCANLEGANLANANLTNLNLTKANLTNANLEGANLYNAKLTNANLTDAILTNANLSNMNLTDVNLTGVDLTGVKMNNVILTGVNLTGMNLTDVSLRNANLTNANLTNANLTNANLTNANLTNADLTNSNRTNANLTNANLTGTNLMLARAPAATWVEDKDCIKQDCPISTVAIPEGRGFKLKADNDLCYDALSLAEMRRNNLPLRGPTTRRPFTEDDIIRIDAFRAANPNLRLIGGRPSNDNNLRDNYGARKAPREKDIADAKQNIESNDKDDYIKYIKYKNKYLQLKNKKL